MLLSGTQIIIYQSIVMQRKYARLPDSKVYGANMEPTWVLSVPDGPHVGAMKLANRVIASKRYSRRKEIDTTARKSLAMNVLHRSLDNELKTIECKSSYYIACFVFFNESWLNSKTELNIVTFPNMLCACVIKNKIPTKKGIEGITYILHRFTFCINFNSSPSFDNACQNVSLEMYYVFICCKLDVSQ